MADLPNSEVSLEAERNRLLAEVERLRTEVERMKPLIAAAVKEEHERDIQILVDAVRMFGPTLKAVESATDTIRARGESK